MAAAQRGTGSARFRREGCVADRRWRPVTTSYSVGCWFMLRNRRVLHRHALVPLGTRAPWGMQPMHVCQCDAWQ